MQQLCHVGSREHVSEGGSIEEVGVAVEVRQKHAFEKRHGAGRARQVRSSNARHGPRPGGRCTSVPPPAADAIADHAWVIRREHGRVILAER